MSDFDETLFRLQFPEFASPTTYPTILLDAYWDTASIFITADGYPCAILSGKQGALALNYLTAHLLVIGTQQGAGAAGAGNAPGSNQGGFETSASIGEVSVAKLAPPAADAWEWWLMQTPYGQALLGLLKILAVGGMSVGGLPERLAFRKVGGVFW